MSFTDDMAAKMSKHSSMMPGDDEPDDAADSDGDYKAAVSAFIDAVHSKDAEGAADALKSAIELCPDEDDEAPDSSRGGHAAMLLIPHGKG